MVEDTRMGSAFMVPDGSVRKWKSIALILGLFSTVLLFLLTSVYRQPIIHVGGPAAATVPGCIEYPEEISATPDRATIIDVTVTYGECVDPEHIPAWRKYQRDNELAQTALRKSLAGAESKSEREKLQNDYYDWLAEAQNKATLASASTLVGGRARLRLISPSFPGKIGVISSENQQISQPDDVGTWSWEVHPDRPGDYSISLVLSILDPKTGTLKTQNRRVPIELHSHATFSYYLFATWSAALAFLTSLQGLIVGAVGAIAAVAGLLPRLRRSKREPEEPFDTRGYL